MICPFCNSDLTAYKGKWDDSFKCKKLSTYARCKCGFLELNIKILPKQDGTNILLHPISEEAIKNCKAKNKDGELFVSGKALEEEQIELEFKYLKKAIESDKK